MESPSSVMSSPSKVLHSPLSSPSKALNPLSPDRLNQQMFHNSPSLPNDVMNMQRKPRGLSDVQSKVAFLNNLSRAGSPGGSAPQPSAASSAALQRAILGREEAESALARVSDQLSESQSREHRISERLESLLEELQAEKERKAHERTLFEKEIRKARKEAFRAGSAVVQVQEDLKQARSEAKTLKDEVQSERQAKEKAQQEAFERAYTLAGLMEEVEVLKKQLHSMEASNRAHNLEARARKLRDQNNARMSIAEGDLEFLLTPRPLKRSMQEAEDRPVAEHSHPDVADGTPTKRPRLSDITPQEESQDDLLEKMDNYIMYLKGSLKREEKFRIEAEEMVDFMKMECSMRSCTCRLEEEREKAQASKATKLTQPTPENPHHGHDHHSSHSHIHPDVDNLPQPRKTEAIPPLGAKRVPQHEKKEQKKDEQRMELEPEQQMKSEPEQAEDLTLTFSPVTGTFRTIPSPVRKSPTKQPDHGEYASLQSHVDSEMIEPLQAGSPLPRNRTDRYQTPSEAAYEFEYHVPAHDVGMHQPPVKGPHSWEPEGAEKRNLGIHHVKHGDIRKIPLREEGSDGAHQPTGPGTPIDRQEALAQIRARRGRTSTMKRPASANEGTFRAGGMGVTPVRAARRIPAVQNADGRHSDMRVRRDMSAPIRMHHR
ncbi:hypothetical protein BDV25DRAFT_153583 [Aspergillus avenaceus]|uniref:Uncharacterized protein n=1 Tax=Aspergillus avenaceus TaxID=36643 RepID=A0A5N6TX98_ASPAV|nr:hypothetical protein BDV25DRAFT_153583 [Aspergillus avenaceus]